MPVSSSLTSVLDCHDDSALRTYNQTLGLALSPEVTELLSEQAPPIVKDPPPLVEVADCVFDPQDGSP